MRSSSSPLLPRVSFLYREPRRSDGDGRDRRPLPARRPAHRRRDHQRTKALILNSPNNPTGVVYGDDVLDELNGIVRDPVLVISDEPYRPLVYDGLRPPEIASIDRAAGGDVVLVESDGDFGERIGYLAIPPHLAEAGPLRNACTFANRILGYINAPAIWQRVVGEVPDATVDVSQYQEKRDLLCGALTRWATTRRARRDRTTCFQRRRFPTTSPSSGCCRKKGSWPYPGPVSAAAGYMRLSLTIPRQDIERSLPGFARAIRNCAAAEQTCELIKT